MGWNPFAGKRVLESETIIEFFNEENDYIDIRPAYHKPTLDPTIPIPEIPNHLYYGKHTQESDYVKANSYFNRGFNNIYQNGHLLAKYNSIFHNQVDLTEVQNYLDSRFSPTDIDMWLKHDNLIAKDIDRRNISIDEWIIYCASNHQYAHNLWVNGQDNFPYNYGNDFGSYRNRYVRPPIMIYMLNQPDMNGNTIFNLLTDDPPLLDQNKSYDLRYVYLYIESNKLTLVSIELVSTKINQTGFLDIRPTHGPNNATAVYTIETSSTDLNIISDDTGIVVENATGNTYRDKFYGVYLPPVPKEEMIIITFTKDTPNQVSNYIETFPYKKGIITSIDDNITENDFWDCMPVIPILVRGESKKKWFLEKETNIWWVSRSINPDVTTDENASTLLDPRPEFIEDERDFNRQFEKSNKTSEDICKTFIEGIKYHIRTVKDEYKIDTEKEDSYDNLKDCSLKQYCDTKDLKDLAFDYALSLMNRYDKDELDPTIHQEEINIVNQISDSFNPLKDWSDRKEQFDQTKYIFYTYMLNPFSKRDVVKKAIFFYLQELHNKQPNAQANEYGILYTEDLFNKAISFDKIISRVFHIGYDSEYTVINGIKMPIRRKYEINTDDDRYIAISYRLKEESYDKHDKEIEDSDWIKEAEYEIINCKFYTRVVYGGYADGNDYYLKKSNEGKIGFPLPIQIFDYMHLFEKDELAYYCEAFEIYTADIIYIKWYQRNFWKNLFKIALVGYAVSGIVVALLSGNIALAIEIAVKTYAFYVALDYIAKLVIEYIVKYIDPNLSKALIVIIAVALAYTANDSSVALKYLGKGSELLQFEMQYEVQLLEEKLEKIQNKEAELDELLDKDETEYIYDFDFDLNLYNFKPNFDLQLPLKL
jgi:hypothetical protein